MEPKTDSQETSLFPFKLFELDFDLVDSRAEMVKKIRWIIRLRFVITVGVAGLMFFTGWQGVTQHPTLTRSTLIAVLITSTVALLLNIIYYLALRRQVNLAHFVSLQLFIDVLIFGSYVYRTGGVTSPFSFLFMLPVIAGAILVSGRMAMDLAVFSAVTFSALAFFGATGVIEHVSYFVALDQFVQKWSYVGLMITVNVFGFITVGALSSFLMTAVRSRTRSLADASVRLERDAQLLQMLYQVSRAGVDARDQEDVISRIGRLLVRGLNLDRVLFYLADERGEKLVLAREFYHPRLKGLEGRERLRLEIPLREDAGVTAICAIERRPENVPDPKSHPLINRELAERVGQNPFAVAPMVANRELIGVLGVDRKFEEGVLDEDEFRLLIAFADQAAAALRTARFEKKSGDRGPAGQPLG